MDFILKYEIRLNQVCNNLNTRRKRRSSKNENETETQGRTLMKCSHKNSDSACSRNSML